jgi:hypothetical protein
MATQRKPLSTRTRFDVFKRDAFTCQYCGATPPAVVLHIDHVHPVALGGTNDKDNLITACAGCNGGKAAIPLTTVPRRPALDPAEVKEREAQLRAYKKLIAERALRIEDDVDEVDAAYQVYKPGYCLTERSRVSVRKFLETMPVHEVVGAMHTAMAKPGIQGRWEYFCGICWSTIKAINTRGGVQ